MYRFTLSYTCGFALIPLSLGLQLTEPEVGEGDGDDILKRNHSEAFRTWLDMTLTPPPWQEGMRTFQPSSRSALQECKYRVAVVTAGTIVRYFLESAAQSLLSPMAQQG